MKSISPNTLRLAAVLAGVSLAVMLLYPPLAGLAYSRHSLADGLSIAGMLLLVVGLFRLVNRMGQFDSIRYGFKKYMEVIRTKDYVRSKSKFPSLADYKAQHPYQKTYLPFLAAAAVDLIVSLLLA